MRKIFSTLLLCSLILFLCGCSSYDSVVNSLSAYQDMVAYTEGGFQDYTDYAIYTYRDLDESVLSNCQYFINVSSDDMENILSYIDNFENGLKQLNQEVTILNWQQTIPLIKRLLTRTIIST